MHSAESLPVYASSLRESLLAFLLIGFAITAPLMWCRAAWMVTRGTRGRGELFVWLIPATLLWTIGSVLAAVMGLTELAVSAAVWMIVLVGGLVFFVFRTRRGRLATDVFYNAGFGHGMWSSGARPEAMTPRQEQSWDQGVQAGARRRERYPHGGLSGRGGDKMMRADLQKALRKGDTDAAESAHRIVQDTDRARRRRRFGRD